MADATTPDAGATGTGMADAASTGTTSADAGTASADAAPVDASATDAGATATPSADAGAGGTAATDAATTADAGAATADAGTTTPADAGTTAPASADAGAAGAAPAAGGALTAERIQLVGESGQTMSLAVRTPLGKHIVRQFGEDSNVWDTEQCTLERGADGAWQIVPEPGTTNETLLNGAPVTGPQPLHEGDVIAVGRAEKGIARLPLTVRTA
ncbi:FHA domain-containing protein [Longimicrobium sp.]|uniref:FHA domain-containing protein n=1 Tax=Longimicrobium sp. TaxID=2029185 RepID=UPI002E35C068|nr:FHA domain-containing protein [Longimicrobium sp.]HEX6040541.1 FHA domain-containing protein [Longimicrobium sp.]